MLLTARNVAYSYTSVTQVLYDVSFDVPENSIVGLVGPNGSGKSTLIKVLLDLLKIQNGTVSIDSRQHHEREAKMASIYLASNDYLPEFLSGEEYLRFLHGLYGEPLDSELMKNQFERYGMEGRHKNLVEDYSHGMRKKLQLIAAFTLKRKMTVIDETLNGIDLDALYTFEQDVQDLASDGRAVLLCSHDFPMLENVADKILMLHRGILVVDSPTVEVIEDHGSLSNMVREYLQKIVS